MKDQIGTYGNYQCDYWNTLNTLLREKNCYITGVP